MSEGFRIEINMDEACPQCGKRGAQMVEGKPAACLSCTLKNLKAIAAAILWQEG